VEIDDDARSHCAIKATLALLRHAPSIRASFFVQAWISLHCGQANGAPVQECGKASQAP
jgi:hypothetical protein